jgi:hypothetical protein
MLSFAGYRHLSSQLFKKCGIVQESEYELRCNKIFYEKSSREYFMQHSDWKMISLIGLILGSICIFSGLIAYNYEVTYGGYFGISMPFYPYRDYAIPLLLVGAVLFVVGFATDSRVREELRAQKMKPTTSFGYCPNCGAKRDADSKFCKNCGKKILVEAHI